MRNYCSGELVTADVREGLGETRHLPFSQDKIGMAVRCSVYLDKDVVWRRWLWKSNSAVGVWLSEGVEELASHCLGQVIRHLEWCEPCSGREKNLSASGT